MPADRKADRNLLSGVFNFVYHEFEHFVANATGGTLPESDLVLDEEDEHDDDESVHAEDKLGRSLFPRSPSIEPPHQSTKEREQRVRFAATPDSPPTFRQGEASLLEQIQKDRDRYKEKTRVLEVEIEILKKELTRRSFSSDILPPPPPPPPPPPVISRTPPILQSSNPPLFASARALLRHAPTPVEKPINPVSKRAGLPTVGIPADKMAAFLDEMKTVRLRKVSVSDKRSVPIEPKHLQQRSNPVTKPTIFEKRPPTSPFPQKSPRRPPPPGRKTQKSSHLLETPSHSSVSSPRNSSHAPTHSLQTQSRQHSPRQRSPSASNRSRSRSMSSRRLTLDEELRNAFATPFSNLLSQNILDEDGTAFSGVGTRSNRRGFLPGGGGAGIPVFRGMGYADEDAEDGETLEEELQHPRRFMGRGRRKRDEDDEYLPPSKKLIKR